MTTAEIIEAPLSYRPLSGLPAVYHRIPWTNAEDLTTFLFNVSTFTCRHGRIIRVDNLTAEGREFIASNALPHQYSFVFHGTSAVIRMLSEECHRVARQIFSELIRQPLQAPSVQVLGGIFSESCARPTPETTNKPDRCYYPADRLYGREKLMWPSLVMEVGTEGWLDLLRSDLGWWFEHSRGWTQTVLLLLVDSTQQSVYLEQWYLGNRPKPLLVSRKTIRCTQTDGPDLFFETVKLMDLTPPELPWFFVEWKDQLASVKRGFLLE